MTITLQAVNELIASLESAGELSIREQKFLKLAKEFKQLAAENVALKAVFSQGEIPSEAVDAFMETAVMDHDWNETSEWSWVENETEVIHAVLDALKPETPATDRIVAGIKAEGVEEFAAYQRAITEEWACKEGHSSLLKVAESAELFAKQLREGGDK
ncbi:dynein light chain family protein [Klebsiella pneumoniae]